MTLLRLGQVERRLKWIQFSKRTLAAILAKLAFLKQVGHKTKKKFDDAKGCAAEGAALMRGWWREGVLDNEQLDA